MTIVTVENEMGIFKKTKKTSSPNTKTEQLKKNLQIETK